MNLTPQSLNQSHADISPRHGFTESQTENMLRDSVLIGAALLGKPMALVLEDDSGNRYRDGSGLTSEQLKKLEPFLSPGSAQADDPPLGNEGELQVIAALSLLDECQQVMGTLYVLSAEPQSFSEDQQQGLRLLAEHIQSIVTMDQRKVEARTAPRPPSAASFVPGLVHELGSFIFGISANLDAFEARFADMDEARKYGGNIRRSLDRMSDFIGELREYGYPQRLSWSVFDLVPLVQEAVEQHRSAAASRDIEIHVQIDGNLPPINADEDGLLATFTRVIGLVVQQEEAGGSIELRIAPSHQGNKTAICGHLDFSSVKFKDVDPARLFEPFYFRVSGLGRLTLPGARRVFESHGGTLTAGLGPEGGMRITFMLPAESTYPLRSAQ